MATKYKTIVKTEAYKCGIYDRCRSRLQSNGARFRVLVDGVKWTGNSGGFRVYKAYLTLEEGRNVLKHYRHAHINELKGNWDCLNRIEVLQMAAGAIR